MKIVCDACQAKYSIADDKIQGKAFKIRCKKCNHIIVVKTNGEGASAVPAAAPAEKSKATAAAAAEQGVWHVVVDGEQVGPLTDAEVKDRLRQGKINSDTLVWKEGFADWMQLSTVPELTAILARITRQPTAKAAAREPAAREPARASGSMRAFAEPAQSSASEADPFAAATVITPAGTADLFASAAAPSAVPAPVAPAPSSPFLFGGVSAQPAEPVAAKSPGNGAGSTHLTGQRNENSVLFSLSNLEALAVPSRSGGVRPPSGTSNTEGSGLIDIRSMAAMTLHEGGQSDMRRGTDALPTFSTPQFSPVAPVLLPMSTSGPPKWVYPVLGLLGVGILVLGYGIYKAMAAPPPGQPLVVAPPPPPAPPPLPPAAATAPVAGNPSATPAAEAAQPAAPEAKPAVEEKAADKGKGDKTKGEKSHRKSSESASSKGSGDSKKGSETASTSTSSSDSATTKSGGKKGSKSLDDLLGEVGSKKGGEDPLKAAPPAVKLITLTQSDIVNAMKGVQPKVQACANQFKVPGTAMATISVASGGRVNSATVTGKFAGTPTGSCVETAAKSAKFPPCQSMTFPWPFTLSPR